MCLPRLTGLLMSMFAPPDSPTPYTARSGPVRFRPASCGLGVAMPALEPIRELALLPPYTSKLPPPPYSPSTEPEAFPSMEPPPPRAPPSTPCLLSDSRVNPTDLRTTPPPPVRKDAPSPIDDDIRQLLTKKLMGREGEGETETHLLTLISPIIPTGHRTAR